MSTNLSTTSSDWLKNTTKLLESKGINSARLDSILILEQVIGLTRIKIVSGQAISLSDNELAKLNELAVRRSKDEPMAYIRGHTEFYGRDFIVDSNTLVPRPESEAFIDLVKNLKIPRPSVLDIGCGGGCLGITIKLEIPDSKVTLTDIYPMAIELANKNAEILEAKVSFRTNDLIDNLTDKYDVFVVNLPYVPDHMYKSKNLSFEPKIALFSGNDGLDLYTRFWEKIVELKNKPEYILCESLKPQHGQINKLARTSGYRIDKSENLIQQFKLV